MPQETSPKVLTTDKIVVLATCSTQDEAHRIARRLLDLRLAACVQISTPVRSLYRWQGDIEESAEVQLFIKSALPLFGRLRDEIAGLHSYTTPEILALTVAEGDSAYLAWMDRELLP